MLMGQIRHSSHIMGFDKVKINTTSLLLLPLEGWGGAQMRGLRRATHKHTETHASTSPDRYHSSRHSHSHPHLCCTLPLHIHSSHTYTHPHVASLRGGVCVLGINILPPPLLSFFSSRVTPFASMNFHDNSFWKGPVFSLSASSFSFTLPR